MGKIGSKAKYIKLLIIAAVLLPLIFIAEVAYVEQHQLLSSSQVQKEDPDKLRAEAEAAWLASQAAHLRGIAKLNSVTSANVPVVNKEFRSFLEPGTGLLALGYADLEGNIWVDTSTPDARPIKKQLYFTEAIAGREYMGQVSGSGWQQEQDAVIISMPVYSQEETIGVIYGIISKATVDSMTAKLISGTTVSKPPVGRWLTWMGGVYLTGLIPLLLLVYLTLRKENNETVVPEPSRPVRVRPKVEPARKPVRPKKLVEPAVDEGNPIERLTKELARVSKKFEELETQERLVAAKKPSAMPDISSSVVIDRVLANAAYKSVEKPSATLASSELKEEPKPERQPLFNYVSAESKESEARVVPVPPVEPREPEVRAVPVPPPEQKEVELSVPDALTGLPSRGEFEKIIAAHGGQPDTAILMLSLDGIKVINDFLGKKAGDQVILAAFDILKTVVGDDCIAIRIEDKFVALLTGISTDMLEDVKKDIKYYLDLHNLRNPELPLSITTGIAAAGEEENLKAVWQQAEADLDKYKAVNRVEARRFIMWSIKRSRGRA